MEDLTRRVMEDLKYIIEKGDYSDPRAYHAFKYSSEELHGKIKDLCDASDGWDDESDDESDSELEEGIPLPPMLLIDSPFRFVKSDLYFHLNPWLETGPIVHHLVTETYDWPGTCPARAMARVAKIDLAAIGRENEMTILEVTECLMDLLQQVDQLGCSSKVWRDISPEVGMAKWAKRQLDHPLDEPSADLWPFTHDPRPDHPEYYEGGKQRSLELLNKLAANYQLSIRRMDPPIDEYRLPTHCIDRNCTESHQYYVHCLDNPIGMAASYKARATWLGAALD